MLSVSLAIMKLQSACFVSVSLMNVELTSFIINSNPVN